MVEIIFENENLVVVNKPAGIVVFSDNENEESLAKIISKKIPVLRAMGKERYGAVHRLDKETSGVLVFAKNKETFSSLQKELLEKKAKKGYITLVFRQVKDDKREICTFIERSPKDRRKQRAFTDREGKREAITSFKAIRKFKNFSLLQVKIKTGRKHQIRCHLASIGHPVAGDKLYRFKDQIDPKELKRHFLHASFLKIGGEKFIAKVPDELKSIIKNLEKYDNQIR